MKKNNVFYDEKQDFEPAENIFSNPVDESTILINNIPTIKPRIKYLGKLYSLIFLEILILLCMIMIFRLYFSDIVLYAKNDFIIYSLILLELIILVIIPFFNINFYGNKCLNLIYFFSYLFCSAFILILVGDNYFEEILMVLLNINLFSFAQIIHLSMNSETIYFHTSYLIVIIPILLIYQIFIIFSDIEIFTMIYISMFVSIFEFLVIYETHTILKGVREDLEQKQILNNSISIYYEVILLIIRLCELIKEGLYYYREKI